MKITPTTAHRQNQLPMVYDTRNLTLIGGIALVILSNLPVVLAGPCEESEKICVRSCLGGGDGREAGACLVGCKLAYWACKWFTGS